MAVKPVLPGLVLPRLPGGKCPRTDPRCSGSVVVDLQFNIIKNGG